MRSDYDTLPPTSNYALSAHSSAALAALAALRVVTVVR
jgi:hypothetical protein